MTVSGDNRSTRGSSGLPFSRSCGRGVSGIALVVDDERIVREVAALMLRHLGLEVLTACDGIEALDVFAEHSESIALTLVDLTMPRMGGKELVGALRYWNPRVPILLTSGFAESEVLASFEEGEVDGFLKKPYTLSSLRSALESVLSRENEDSREASLKGGAE